MYSRSGNGWNEIVAVAKAERLATRLEAKRDASFMMNTSAVDRVLKSLVCALWSAPGRIYYIDNKSATTTFIS